MKISTIKKQLEDLHGLSLPMDTMARLANTEARVMASLASASLSPARLAKLEALQKFYDESLQTRDADGDLTADEEATVMEMDPDFRDFAVIKAALFPPQKLFVTKASERRPQPLQVQHLATGVVLNSSDPKHNRNRLQAPGDKHLSLEDEHTSPYSAPLEEVPALNVGKRR